jgi:hypothetical protein
MSLCRDGWIQAAVDAVVDDTNDGSKSIVIQDDGMSELMG